MPDEHLTADLLQDRLLAEFFALLSEQIFEVSIFDTVEDASRRVNWPLGRGFSAFRYFAWTQALTVDLTQTIVMTQPAVLDQRGVHSVLQRELLGTIDHA